MDLFGIIFIGAGLAMDCFAVSLGIGTGGSAARSIHPIFRLSFHFGLFQGLMTLTGWLLGSTIAHMVANFDHWIIMGLLGWVGTRMIIQGANPHPENSYKSDPSRGSTLILLAVATSLDAMAVGLSLAIVNVNILTSSLIIALISSAMSLAGIFLGHRLGKAFGQRMEIIGGLILNGIGLRIFLTHLL